VVDESRRFLFFIDIDANGEGILICLALYLLLRNEEMYSRLWELQKLIQIIKKYQIQYASKSVWECGIRQRGGGPAKEDQ